MDGDEDGWTFTLQPGAERTLWEANPAFTLHNEVHRTTQAWSVSWVLAAAHEGGPSTVLHDGNFSFAPPAGDGDNQSTSDDGSEASSGGGGMMVLIVSVMALLGIVALVLTLRISSRQHAVGREDDDTLPHSSSPEDAPWTGKEHVEPPSIDPEAAAYHADLLEQGYSVEDALTYTQQYFPQFQP